MACVKMDRRAAPKPNSNWALFLDIDGTLLDIAISPDAVIVPDMLTPLLARATTWLSGAVAIVSGRPLAQIDRLLAPLVLPCAGEHGAVMRMPDGTMAKATDADSMPPAWIAQLDEATRDWEGVLLEEKSHGAAVHYRKAPEREDAIRQLVDAVISNNTRDFEVLPAHKAFEIRNRKLTKAAPVLRFMEQPPFRGRVPVFIGDDVTDQDGFRAARSLNGLGLDVHETFGGMPSEVLRWLDAAIPAMEQ
jgi:trehalose 6-phosphate phosphatase